jgi:hypothetical protein
MRLKFTTASHGPRPVALDEWMECYYVVHGERQEPRSGQINSRFSASHAAAHCQFVLFDTGYDI